MAKKNPALKTIPYLETWDTRYGMSERVVLRKGGKFVDNTSLTALKRGVRVSSRQDRKNREGTVGYPFSIVPFPFL